MKFSEVRIGDLLSNTVDLPLDYRRNIIDMPEARLRTDSTLKKGSTFMVIGRDLLAGCRLLVLFDGQMFKIFDEKLFGLFCLEGP